MWTLICLRHSTARKLPVLRKCLSQSPSPPECSAVDTIVAPLVFVSAPRKKQLFGVHSKICSGYQSPGCGMTRKPLNLAANATTTTCEALVHQFD